MEVEKLKSYYKDIKHAVATGDYSKPSKIQSIEEHVDSIEMYLNELKEKKDRMDLLDYWEYMLNSLPED